MRVEEFPASEWRGKERWEREVVLEAAPVIVGRVLPPDPGLGGAQPPLEEWSCDISFRHVPTHGEWDWKSSVGSEPGGSFRVDWLPPGEYTVSAGVGDVVMGTVRIPHEAPLEIDLQARTVR